jgi:predicted amidohydrolase
MTARRSLAAAQMLPVRGDVEANLERHLRLIRAAAEARARLLVFPELSLTGYELDLADELAFSERDARLMPLVDAVSSNGMIAIVGAPVRLALRLHIGAFILYPDQSVDVYTKRRMGAFSPQDSPDGIVPSPEATVFEPGNRNPLVRFDGRTAAVAVCADVGRPSYAQEAADRGACIYLASMFVIPAHLENDTAKLRDYAVKHSMAVVFANFGGASGGLPSGGSSAVLSERGEVLVQLPVNGAGVAVAVEDEYGWQTNAVILDGL